MDTGYLGKKLIEYGILRPPPSPQQGLSPADTTNQTSNNLQHGPKNSEKKTLKVFNFCMLLLIR